MTVLEGIYLERDRYKAHEFTGKHIDALRTLGVKVKLDVKNGGDLVILNDTSELDHSLCGDDDAIAFVKHKRRID